MTYFDYLFTILIIALSVSLLIGVALYFGYRLGQTMGATVERLRWHEAQVRGAPRVLVVEEPGERVEWPKNLNCE